VCKLCGAPALVHIRPDASDERTVHHFCLRCADLNAAADEWDAADRRLNRAAVCALAGLIVLVISVGADFFAFGRADGFGWKQMTGVFCGAAFFLTGTLLRASTLILVGLIMGGVTLLADWLAFGSSPGFGWHQILGTLLGVFLLVGGCRVRRMSLGR